MKKQETKILLVSKGNEKNYYGYKDFNVFEVIKEGNKFYRFEYSDILKTWIAKGSPITNYILK